MSLRKSLILIFSILMMVSTLLFIFTFSSTSGVSYAAEVEESAYNDSANSADTFNIGDTVKGKLSSYDVDWYKFTVNEKGRFSVYFSHKTISSNNAVWSMSIYCGVYDSSIDRYSDGDELGSYNITGNSNKVSDYFGVDEGTYLICIARALNNNNLYVGVDYSISVSFGASSDWESESNSTMSNANQIDVNTKMTGALTTETDEDWYKFTLTERGVFYVDFKHVSNHEKYTYWNIYLCNKDGSYIDGVKSHFSVYGMYDGATAKYGVEPGTYYIKVTKGDYHYSPNTYYLTVVYSANSNWETENNNKLSTADEIAVNTTVNGSLTSSDDKDYFKFSTNEIGYFYIDFEHDEESSKNLWYMEVSVVDGGQIKNHLGSTYVPGNKGVKSACYGVDKGTFLISIRASAWTGSDYRFTVKFVATDDWETESNDSIYMDKTSLNKAINGALGYREDQDYYVFDVKSATKIQVVFDHAKINATSNCWKCILYNDRLDVLYKEHIAGNGDAVVSDYVDLTPGTYYFKITVSDDANAKFSDASYSVTAIEYHEHNGEWINTTPPTCIDKGIDTKTCSICAHQETREVEMIPHDYEERQTVESKMFKRGDIEYVCKYCGDKYTEKDNSKVWVTVAMSAFAVSIIGGGAYAIIAAIKGKNIFK